MYLLIHKNKSKSEYPLKICDLFMEKNTQEIFFQNVKK